MVIRVLEEKLGFVIIDDEQDDLNISDFILDSLAFINFIVIIEEEIGEELSDDFLDFDMLNSAKGFAEKLDFFMTSSQIDNSEYTSNNRF